MAPDDAAVPDHAAFDGSALPAGLARRTFLFRLARGSSGLVGLGTASTALNLALSAARDAQAAPSLSWGSEPKQSPDFAHYAYVNPDAPRGGTLNCDGRGSFDKLNPFTLRGTAASGLDLLMFETLGDPAMDEPMTVYPLLARDFEFAPDGHSIRFTLDERARFSNGEPVLAQDVKHAFDTLTGPKAHPMYGQYFADVKAAVVESERVVRFDFKRLNHELHMIVATGLPVFSRRWGQAAANATEAPSFDQLTQIEPVSTGPYRIESIDWGKSIRYRRNPDYWGDRLPTRRGMFNFDRIVIKYFKDDTARLEGFKAGEFDWMAEYSARNWVRGHVGRRYDSGDIIKKRFAHGNIANPQGFAMNLRRPMFRDWRIRHALTLAFDFEWMNRQLFYGEYVRMNSYFENSPMKAEGRPQGIELELLESIRDKVNPVVFDDPPLSPSTEPPGSLRENLRRAVALLAEAGWTVAPDGRLRNAAGEAFEFEVLSYSPTLERIAVPWQRNLARLGIGVSLRTTDMALYQKRLDDYEFDVTSHVMGMSRTPGNELFDMFSSAAGKRPGSQNIAGIADPAVDALIERIVQSKDREHLEAAARALDRVLRTGWYLVPHYYSPKHRIAYSKRLSYPRTLPLYFSDLSWPQKFWWFNGMKDARP